MMMDRCGIITKKMVKKSPVIESVEKEKININGSWRLSDDSPTDSLQKQPTSKVQESVLLSFFPDSTFTELKGNGSYEIGKWQFKEADSSLMMLYQEKTDQFKVSPSRDMNGLRWLHFSSGKDSLAFGGFGRSMEQFREDPFYFTHNTWRNKPAHPETKLQIRDRLNGYIGHSIVMMQAALTRRQQAISWEYSKGILIIYKSGIGIKPEEEIPESWINCFYSEEDALMAHAMLKEYLLTTSYKGSATGNWLKDDRDILQSIYNGLKNRKEKDLL